jgi:hypothetical protein
MMASSNGHLAVVEALLHHGAVVDDKDQVLYDADCVIGKISVVWLS